MAKPTQEERRRRKEEARAAQQARKAAAAAARRARRQRGKGADDADHVAVAQILAPLPRLELVTEPGPVKRLHWDAAAGAHGQALAQAASPPAAPSPSAASPGEAAAHTPEPPAAGGWQAPRLEGRRRTLYTTDHGNKVVAYEQGGRRQLAVTETRGGRLEEVPFDEAQVDRVLRDVEPAPPAQQPEPATPGTAKARRFFFLRRKTALQAPPAETPVAELVGRPVAAVPASPQEASPATPGAPVDAWEPDAASAPRPARPASRGPRAAPKPQRAYAGDNHPILDIEGIGPVRARKLEAMGITTTGLLGVARPGRIARRLGVSAKSVRTWQAEAELLKVPGIGPQFAEALARAGISGIDELKQRTAQDISAQVTKYLGSLDATVVGQPVTPRRVAAWKRKAKPMRRVKVDRAALAAPNHGLPPPWLRKPAGAKAGRKAARKAAKAKRPKRRPT